MSPKFQEAIIHPAFKRDGQTHNPAAGTTAVVSVAAVNNVRHYADRFSVSQRNQAAAAYTATLTLRDSSIAGTILAQWEFVTAVNTVDRFSERLAMPGLLSNAMFLVWDPPAASVTQKIALATYRESFS